MTSTVNGCQPRAGARQNVPRAKHRRQKHARTWSAICILILIKIKRTKSPDPTRSSRTRPLSSDAIRELHLHRVRKLADLAALVGIGIWCGFLGPGGTHTKSRSRPSPDSPESGRGPIKIWCGFPRPPSRSYRSLAKLPLTRVMPCLLRMRVQPNAGGC